MVNRFTIAFLLLLAVSLSYGFYIITTNDNVPLRSYPQPRQQAYLVELPDEEEEDDGDDMLFANGGSINPQMALGGEDMDYLDRAERLRQALQQRRALIELAERYSQGISPSDLNGMELVRSPQSLADEYETDSLPIYYESPKKRGMVPVSYVLV
jgi:hypothetical protein